MPVSPLYSSCGKAKPGCCPWDRQLAIAGNSACQVRGQLLLPDVAHPGPHLANWMIQVAVAERGYLAVGGGGEAVGGHRPGKPQPHRLGMLEVGA